MELRHLITRKTIVERGGFKKAAEVQKVKNAEL